MPPNSARAGEVSIATDTYTTAMYLRLAAAAGCAIAIVAVGATRRVGAQPSAQPLAVQGPPLSDAERERVERTMSISTQRYDEWLGPATNPSTDAWSLPRPYWSSPASMDLESQLAFELARARFAGLADSPELNNFRDGVAWHLQSRVVEQLFDLTHHRPGHHAVAIRLFGDHVRWGVPSLVLPVHARDERAAPPIAHAAAAVATLENVVGWPALAAALRVVASDGTRPLNRDAVERLLEGALGVPVGWFFTTLDVGFHLNYRVTSVDTRAQSCGNQPCQRTAITVARDGQPLYADPASSINNPIPLRIDFGNAAPSTIWWSGSDAIKTVVVESELAPIAVTLDPDRSIRLDDNRLDQRWMAEPGRHPRPVKPLAAWVIWLQHAALTYGVLL